MSSTEVDDCEAPGHWEGDLIIGLHRSAIRTPVERTTRSTMLVHLPRQDGFVVIPRTKNGPLLAGYEAITMRKALAWIVTPLSEQLRRSLTWDRGKELSVHASFRAETGIAVYVADPPVGDATDNALMESTIGLYKTELINRATSWSSANEVECETANWVHWFNTDRVHTLIGMLPRPSTNTCTFKPNRTRQR